jgi:hypothetical protein
MDTDGSRYRGIEPVQLAAQRRVHALPPPSSDGIFERHNLMCATKRALHMPISYLSVAGIYDLQSSLTAFGARDRGFRIDRQNFRRLDPALPLGVDLSGH